MGLGRCSEDLFYAHDELVSFSHVLGADFVVGVNKEEPFGVIHDDAGTDSADLFAQVGQGDAVRARIGDLFQVVAVGAHVDIFDDLVGGGRIEVDGLPGLGGASVFAERRRVVGGVPEIVDAPASLNALGGIERDRVVRMDVPGIVADVDGAVGRVAADWGIDVQCDALINWHAVERVLGPLEDDGSEGEIARSLPDAVAARVYIGCGEHDLCPVPGAENARVGCQPRNVEQRRSAVDVGHLGDDLAGVAEGLVVVDALADELDEPTGEGNGVQEAGIPEVNGRESGRLLRLRARAEEANEGQHDPRGR